MCESSWTRSVAHYRLRLFTCVKIQILSYCFPASEAPAAAATENGYWQSDRPENNRTSCVRVRVCEWHFNYSQCFPEAKWSINLVTCLQLTAVNSEHCRFIIHMTVRRAAGSSLSECTVCECQWFGSVSALLTRCVQQFSIFILYIQFIIRKMQCFLFIWFNDHVGHKSHFYVCSHTWRESLKEKLGVFKNRPHFLVFKVLK